MKPEDEYRVVPLDDEKAKEFAKKRNYTYECPSVEKQYTIEKCPWDEWKATKDIV